MSKSFERRRTINLAGISMRIMLLGSVDYRKSTLARAQGVTANGVRNGLRKVIIIILRNCPQAIITHYNPEVHTLIIVKLIYSCIVCLTVRL